MENKIFLIDFYCQNCTDEIKGTICSPKQLLNKDNNTMYTQIRCPYCKKTYYIKNENGNPIRAVEKLSYDDLLTDDDNPNFK